MRSDLFQFSRHGKKCLNEIKAPELCSSSSIPTPTPQRAALRSLYDAIGFARRLLACELPDWRPNWTAPLFKMEQPSSLPSGLQQCVCASANCQNGTLRT